MIYFSVLEEISQMYDDLSIQCCPVDPSSQLLLPMIEGSDRKLMEQINGVFLPNIHQSNRRFQNFNKPV